MDTSVNPGNYSKVKLLSPLALFKKCLKLLFKFEIKKSFNLAVAGGINLYNKTFRKHAKHVYQCSVCKMTTAFFYVHADDMHIVYNSICPNCNSRSRHRGLVFIYQKMLTAQTTPISIMHFAPEPVFYPLLRNIGGVSYQTADLFLDDVDFKEDIQKLTFSNKSYDFVLCNHVIEHVPDDEAALAEISRILKPEGRAIITIPGNFKRKETIYFNHLRYNGHYRDYGIDVLNKMKIHFRHVEYLDMNSFDQGDQVRYAIRPFDIAFICKK